MPPIKFDWTVSVSNLLTVAFFVVSMATAWFSLKEDVQVLNTKQTATELIVKEVKEIQRENKVELKQDLRDLRDDIRNALIPNRTLAPNTSLNRSSGLATR